jgi:hypothetical protein
MGNPQPDRNSIGRFAYWSGEIAIWSGRQLTKTLPWPSYEIDHRSLIVTIAAAEISAAGLTPRKLIQPTQPFELLLDSTIY